MGPLRGRPAWNEVAKPSSMTEGMQKGNDNPEGWAGAAYVPSKETPDRPEQAGGMKSDIFRGKIGRGGVGKSTLKSPPAEPMPKGLMDGGKY